MYDLIYLADECDYHRAQSELKQEFPDACFEDASDSIHHDRFSIEIDLPIEDYRLQLLDLGLALQSLNFQLWILEKPEEVRASIDKWKANEWVLNSTEENKCAGLEEER